MTNTNRIRKLIMWNVMTLDGYFEGAHNWDLSFHNFIWGQEFEKLSLEQLQSADYLVFGSVTYKGMSAYWTKAEAETGEQEVAKLMKNYLPAGMYIMLVQENHNVVRTYKFTNFNTY